MKNILRQAHDKKGLTLIELVLAMAISIFIFELVFFVYMSLFRSWDIGFFRGQTEDEGSHAVQTISKEIRSASPNIVLSPNNPTQLSYSSKVMYLDQKDLSYADFLAGNYVVSKNANLKILKEMVLDESNYGAGRIVAKELIPPSGLTGGTRFSIDPNGLINIQVIARGQNSVITLNTMVFTRSQQ